MKQIKLKEAVSIGIGGMVGGGIFATLGLAVSVAKGATPLAFMFSGFIALITSYSYAKLSVEYPNRGGTVTFINEGFGRNFFSGGINNILWLSYIIMLALYASAFGSYAPNLFPITGNNIADFHIYASGITLIATIINYYNVKIVSSIEYYTVIIKITILLLFVVIGLYGLMGSDTIHQLSTEHWATPLNILAGGMLIFVAYEGFELIANVAPNIKNKKDIPKAYFYSVLFVILLYIVIATITIGSLPFESISVAKEYALAEAARPVLGDIGFSIITIAALISTFSAINASLYGGTRVSYEIAEDDELPHAFTDQFWNQPVGLLITSIATVLIANTLNMQSISIIGSVGFLLVFAAVNFIGFKLSSKIQANKTIPVLGFVLCSVALAVLLIQQYSSNQFGVIASLAIITFCFLSEYVYKKIGQL